MCMSLLFLCSPSYTVLAPRSTTPRCPHCAVFSWYRLSQHCSGRSIEELQNVILKDEEIVCDAAAAALNELYCQRPKCTEDAGSAHWREHCTKLVVVVQALVAPTWWALTSSLS